MKHTTTKFLTSVFLFSIVSCLNAQDIIITKEAKKIEAKILEVSKSDIKYKELDNLEGPTFILETSEINTIIYSNGKVVLYNTENQTTPTKMGVQPQSEEYDNSVVPNDLYVFVKEPARTTLFKYLDGFPKNIVAIKGDYSMIFDKQCRMYFDIDYSDAELGEYEPDRQTDEYNRKGEFDTYLKMEKVDVDKKEIIQSACDAFNKRMLNKKCTFMPISEQINPPSEKEYKMVLQIERIDVGSDVVSVLSNKRTNAGGAIICGTIEIRKVSTNELISTLIVDRVQGIGDERVVARIKNVVEELIANKLFFIKEYKLYTKY